jgi:hypothetical protein
LHNAIEERERVVAGPRGARIVSSKCIRREGGQRFAISARSEKLERAHPDVARGHARQDCAGKGLFPEDRLAGHHRGERARRRNAQRSHRFTHDVLAQDRSERRTTIALA